MTVKQLFDKILPILVLGGAGGVVTVLIQLAMLQKTADDNSILLKDIQVNQQSHWAYASELHTRISLLEKE